MVNKICNQNLSCDIYLINFFFVYGVSGIVTEVSGVRATL